MGQEMPFPPLAIKENRSKQIRWKHHRNQKLSETNLTICLTPLAYLNQSYSTVIRPTLRNLRNIQQSLARLSIFTSADFLVDLSCLAEFYKK